MKPNGGGILISKFFSILSILMLFSLLSCQDQIDPRSKQTDWPPSDPNSPLIGTSWVFSDWGDQIIFFETAETVVFQNVNYIYTYNAKTRTGKADYLNSFVVQANYEKLTFLSWRNFGHSVDFTRIQESK